MKYFYTLFLLIPFLGTSQSIKGTFSPAKDFNYALLYQETPKGPSYIDNAKLNAEGSFEMKPDASLKPGIYKIVFALPQEENNFDFIYTGKESIDFNFSYSNGLKFTESEENKLWYSYLETMNRINKPIKKMYDREPVDQKALMNFFKLINDTQHTYEDAAKDKMVYDLIRANRTYIPEEYENFKTYFKNLKDQFLKTVDFTNPFLQNSSFIKSRVESYVFGMVQNSANESYKNLVDDAAQALNKTSKVYQVSVLQTIFKRFEAQNNYEVASYIAEKYLMPLSMETANAALIKELIAFKNTAIGARAPNFEISASGKKTMLYDLNSAEHYLLIFWSSTCSHCLKQLPKVKDLVSNFPDLRVVAYGLEDDKANWESTIISFPNFTHVLGLGKWDNPLVETYGITGTPTYFVLDKNKTIINKPYSLDDLENVINGL